MPIAPELRHFYRSPEYLAARDRALERAGYRCEWCAKPRGEVLVARDGSGRWKELGGSTWRWPILIMALPGCRVQVMFVLKGFPRLDLTESVCADLKYALNHFPPPAWTKLIQSKIGAAHLDHNPANNADDNLAALCARCHLIHDAPHHRHTQQIRRAAGTLRLELVA